MVIRSTMVSCRLMLQVESERNEVLVKSVNEFVVRIVSS